MADAPYIPGIPELVEQSYQNSKAHGFWEGHSNDNVPSKLMLIVSELAEALESYRDPASDDLVKVPVELLEDLVVQAEDHGGPSLLTEQVRALIDKQRAKPVGFDIELADALIRIFDLAGAKDIDLVSALQRKMEYNKGRERMHGKVV